MLRDRSGRLPGNFSKRVDGELTRAQGQDNADPSGVREHREHLDRELHVSRIRRVRRGIGMTPGIFVICIHTQIMTYGDAGLQGRTIKG